MNRYRVQGTMFAEREGLIPGSSDFGVGMLGPLPGGRGEFQAGVYNGEGYAHQEANRAKSVQGRLTVRPFTSGLWQGLRLSAFGDLGAVAPGQPRRLVLGMISYESPRIVATFQGLRASERITPAEDSDIHRRGYSLFIEARRNTVGPAVFLRLIACRSRRGRRARPRGSSWVERIGPIGTGCAWDSLSVMKTCERASTSPSGLKIGSSPRCTFSIENQRLHF